MSVELEVNDAGASVWGGDGEVLLFNMICIPHHSRYGARGGVVVKALRYKPAGRGFDSRWGHWNFSVT